MVILTARNEKRGKDTVEFLRHECNLSNIIYHPLDVLDDASVASLAQHIESRYGKLDILVNNAGVRGVEVDQDGLRALNIDPSTWLSGAAAASLLEGVVIQTYDGAVKCLNTNYHGLRRVTEGLLRTHCPFVFSLCDERLSTAAFSFYFLLFLCFGYRDWHTAV